MQRKTKKTATVGRAILATDGPIFGYPLMKQTGLRSGTLYPILWRMLKAGWLSDGWDETTIPARRYYRVTELGRKEIPKWIGETTVQS